MAKEMTLNKAMQPVFILNALIGIGVIEYPLGTPRFVLSFIYSLTCLFTYCTIVFFSCDYISNIHFLTKVKEYMYKVVFYGCSGTAVYAIILSWFRMGKIQICLKRFELADDLLLKLGIEKNYAQRYRMNVIGIVLIITSFTILSIIVIIFIYNDDTPIEAKALMSTAIHYPIFLLYMSNYNFVSIVMCSRLKLSHLNNILRDVAKRCNNYTIQDSGKQCKIGNNVYFIHLKSDYSNVIRQVREAHLTLIDICYNANETYGRPILLSLTFSFLMILLFFYNFYIQFFLLNSGDISAIHELISTSFLTFFYIANILVLTYTCTATSVEAKETGQILPQLSFHDEVRDEVLHFTLQLIQNPLQFTANGFCKVDCSLIRDMAGSILTYLVILVQLYDT